MKVVTFLTFCVLLCDNARSWELVDRGVGVDEKAKHGTMAKSEKEIPTEISNQTLELEELAANADSIEVDRGVGVDENAKHETIAKSEEEVPTEISNQTLQLEELAANADGIEIFMVALEKAVLDGGDSVKIPEEIDPEGHIITLDNAFDRLEEFLEEQTQSSQNILANIENELEKLGDQSNYSLSQQAKDDVMEIMQSFIDAKEDIENYRKSQSIETMYEYYEDETNTANTDEERADDDEEIINSTYSLRDESMKTGDVGDNPVLNLETENMLAGFDEDPLKTDQEIKNGRQAMDPIDDNRERQYGNNDGVETKLYPYIDDAFFASNEDYGNPMSNVNHDSRADDDFIGTMYRTTSNTPEAEMKAYIIKEESFTDELADGDDETFSFRRFHFPTTLYVAIAVPLVFFFVLVVAFAAYRQRVIRRSVAVKARSLNEVEKERRISFVSICDAHRFPDTMCPRGNAKLPSYLEVISEKVEPAEHEEK